MIVVDDENLLLVNEELGDKDQTDEELVIDDNDDEEQTLEFADKIGFHIVSGIQYFVAETNQQFPVYCEAKEHLSLVQLQELYKKIIVKEQFGDSIDKEQTLTEAESTEHIEQFEDTIDKDQKLTEAESTEDIEQFGDTIEKDQTLTEAETLSNQNLLNKAKEEAA